MSEHLPDPPEDVQVSSALDRLTVTLPVRPDPATVFRQQRRLWVAVTIPMVLAPIIARLWMWGLPGAISWLCALLLVGLWWGIGVWGRRRAAGQIGEVVVVLTAERLQLASQAVLLENIEADHLDTSRGRLSLKTTEGDIDIPVRLLFTELTWLRAQIRAAVARRRAALGVSEAVRQQVPEALEKLRGQ